MAEQTISDSDFRTFLRLTDIAGKYGGPEGLQNKISKLEEDAATFRTKAKDLEGKVAPEGATVLTGDDAKRWDAFQALGKTPEELAQGIVLTPDDKKEYEAFKALELKAADIPAIVKKANDLEAKDAQRTRTDTIAAVVEAMGWPKETAATIADMKSLDEAAFEVKTEKTKDAAGADVDGKVAYVTLKGGQPTKFAEFASQTDSLKGIRTSGTEKTSEGNPWEATPANGTQGGYDAAKVGREMAERQKAHASGSTNAALT
jgi:hypothetical protein